jgi:hypothetical protein
LSDQTSSQIFIRSIGKPNYERSNIGFHTQASILTFGKESEKIMKVKVLWNPMSIRIPNVCARCGRNPPTQYIGTQIRELKSWKSCQDHYLKFPYCSACFEEESKGSGLFRRKKPAIEPTSVELIRVGKLFKKKEIYFVTFEFLNPTYAQLFREANEHILLETVIDNVTKDL